MRCESYKKCTVNEKKKKQRKRSNGREEKKVHRELIKSKIIFSTTKKKKTDIDYTFPYLSYVTDYDCLSIPIIVLCDRLLMAICHYHMDHHFFPSPFTVYDVRQL